MTDRQRAQNIIDQSKNRVALYIRKLYYKPPARVLSSTYRKGVKYPTKLGTVPIGCAVYLDNPFKREWVPIYTEKHGFVTVKVTEASSELDKVFVSF